MNATTCTNTADQDFTNVQYNNMTYTYSTTAEKIQKH
jgi:hypothetical protein